LLRTGSISGKLPIRYSKRLRSKSGESMESLKRMAELIATGVEVVAALIIVYEVLDGTVLAIIDRRSKTCLRKTTWVRFGVRLSPGLECELAADIVRTAIAPTWANLSQLTAIGVIRHS